MSDPAVLRQRTAKVDHFLGEGHALMDGERGLLLVARAAVVFDFADDAFFEALGSDEPWSQEWADRMDRLREEWAVARGLLREATGLLDDLRVREGERC